MNIESRTCPECGSTIPADAPAGLCIRCLLSMAGGADLPATPSGVQIPANALRELGDYELIREIGRGGMGVVFEARQRRLNRLVALKLLIAGELASEIAIARFKEEAAAIARMDHPNIVNIYEVGEHDGRHFYTMKLVSGKSLAWHLDTTTGRPNLSGTRSSSVRNSLNPATVPDSPSGLAPAPPVRQWNARTAAALIAKIARAVHFVHQRGIIHRDLSPENILIDSEGEPWVVDFGLSRLLDDGRRFTRSFTILGKPDYMAPEQADPSGPDLTTSSDLFSLGVILYEMLTGCRPFAAITPLAILDRVRHASPKPPSSLNPLVDRDLNTICLKCLTKEPAGRYQSGDALADDLDRWLRHDTILARPSGPIERSIKWARRHPAKAALALVSGVAVAGPLVTGMVLYRFVLPQQARSHVILGRDHNISGFALTFETNRTDRATMNFDLDMFKNRSHPICLYFTNLPPGSQSWVTNLACQVFADIPGAPDKPRSPVVRHGDTFVISKSEWADRAYYVAPFGWKGEDVLSRAPNARLCVIILDGDVR